MSESRIELLRESLTHALTCPIAQDCFRIMRDEPENITGCDGCRRMLLVWKIEVLESMKGVLHGS